MRTKILLVDDEPSTLNMLGLLLDEYGYEVFTAENGQRGLEVFQQERPPLVLTDIKMPVMDGMEMLAQIKQIDATAEVIVITGHGDMDLAIKALNLDATDFIDKPIRRQALDQALRRAQERLQLARRDQTVAVRMERHAALIDVVGSVTAASEQPLTDAFTQGQGKDLIVLRFNESASLNGAGLAVLTLLIRSARAQGTVVAVVGLSENFRKVFEMVGITKLVVLCDSLDEALTIQ